MDKRQEIFAEIHKLISQQLETLRGVLQVEDVALYAERLRRIDQLLEHLSKHNL